MISIYTFTLGRDKYLTQLLESIHDCNDEYQETEHFICCQGIKLKEETLSLIRCFNLLKQHNITVLEWDENYGIAEGMNKVLPMLSGDIIMKLDEDAVLRSPNFFTHVREIHKLVPNLVFSPFPVGLINNLAGPLSHGRTVIYSKDLDTYYTLRTVDHVGGFARVSPADPTKNWIFDYDKNELSSGSEDGQHSNKCKALRIPMAYLENALIVEHNESTLGQHERYGVKYFGKRF